MHLLDMTSAELVHQNLCRIAKTRAEEDYELGRWLVAAERLRVSKLLGYASYAEYVSRLFGFHHRECYERARVGRELESLTMLADALREGTLCWSAVRELTRVATSETEEEWIAAAKNKPVRQIERMVSGKSRGAKPLDPATVDAPKQLRFEVSAPTWALFQEARRTLVAELGGPVDDDALIATLARAVLAGRGARDEGLASYQIALTTCHVCRVTTQKAGAGEVVVDEPTLDRARCDAQHLGRVDVSNPQRATQTVPPRTRRAVMRRHDGRCAVPGCTHAAFIDLHHTERRADGGDHDPEKLVPLCTAHHTAAHVGRLVVRGTYSAGFIFEHADGRRYGDAEVSPARASTLATVLEILVGMGFTQREAQAMVDRAKTHVGRETTVEQALRAALREAALPSGVGFVRERVARYDKLAA